MNEITQIFIIYRSTCSGGDTTRRPKRKWPRDHLFEKKKKKTQNKENGLYSYVYLNSADYRLNGINT